MEMKKCPNGQEVSQNLLVASITAVTEIHRECDVRNHWNVHWKTVSLVEITTLCLNDLSNPNYHTSINNRQAIQRSSIDRRSNAWLTLGWESETVVCDTKMFFRSRSRFFKSLNDRQSDILLKFKESKEPIQFKLSYVDVQLPRDPEAVQIAVLRWGPWFL